MVEDPDIILSSDKADCDVSCWAEVPSKLSDFCGKRNGGPSQEQLHGRPHERAISGRPHESAWILEEEIVSNTFTDQIYKFDLQMRSICKVHDLPSLGWRSCPAAFGPK